MHPIEKPNYLYLLLILLVTGASAAVAVGWVADRSPHAVDGAAPTAVAGTAAALPVLAAHVHDQQTFTLRRAFAGRVQARRQSALGFEASGRLHRVLVDEGDPVSAGTVLAVLDTELLDARRAELLAVQQQAEAELSLANATLQRLRGIVDRGGVSRQGLDEARDGQRAARAALELARRRVQSVDVSLAKARLLAPFDGVVVSRIADEGRVLAGGEPVLSLQERAAPEIRVGIAGRLADSLEPGREYPLQWRDVTIVARLRAVLPMRASRTRTVDALFDPVTDHRTLRPGDTVVLRLQAQVDEPGSWLPMTALTEGERGLWNVYVAEAADSAGGQPVGTHRVVPRAVKVLHQESGRVYVRGALSPDDLVVVTGLQRIVPGQRVSPKLTQTIAG